MSQPARRVGLDPPIRAMASRQKKAQSTRNDRGAALVVALGVLAFLIILSLTFWQAARREMQTATNTADSIRAELLTDGAFAIAIAFLNHDLAAHPSYTSLDHAWRSYFNGAWAVGKPWLWAPILVETPGNGFPFVALDPEGNAPMPLFNNNGIHRDIEFGRPIPGLPEIPTLDGLVTAGFTMDRADANYFGDNIYIPRIIVDPNAGVLEQDVNDVDADGDFSEFLLATDAAAFVVSSDLADSPAATGFALNLTDNVFRTFLSVSSPLNLVPADADSTNDLLPAEQIHFWTDVDNDGDGLNDSIWIPVGADVIADADGIDNDLDGFIDEAGETAVFLYDGTADGLDNNGDGIVDDFAERVLFFTAPILDSSGFGLLDTSIIETLAVDTDRRGELGLSPIGIIFDTNPENTVDVIDNNFDLLVNGAETFVVSSFDLALDTDHRALGYRQIDPQYLIDGTFFVSSTGETVSEIVGRVAILITDEASKVNINAAGGHSYLTNKTYVNGDGDLIDAAGAPLTRAFGTGMGPAEFEPRILLEIGAARANRMWTFRMGATVDTDRPPHPLGLNPGDALSSSGYTDALFPFDFDGNLQTPGFDGFEALANDISLPGYGFVDDNGNALALALNGIDDDGDAEFYQTDGIDNDLNGIVDDEGEGVDEGLSMYFDGNGNPVGFPSLEGIDEPQEFQHFRPLRNRVAEGDRDFADGVDGDFDGSDESTDGNDGDNDSDGIFDEIGELGDRFYRTHEQLKILDEIGEVRFNNIRNFITAHSQDRNDRHGHRDNQADFSDDRLRTSTGPRLDYNIARAGEIAQALRNDWLYPVSQPLTVTVNDDGTTIITDDQFPQDTLRTIYALGLRREDTTVSTFGRLLDQGAGGSTSIVFEADANLRTGQLGVSIKDFADRDFARSELTSKIGDTWWAGRAAAAALIDPSLNDAANAAQDQLISYTVAGIESIRINEIMVRPVRRFEAEAITPVDDPAFTFNATEPVFLANTTDFNPADPEFVDPVFQPALNPNRFTPDQDFTFIDSTDPLPDFRMRVRTTANRLDDFALDGGQLAFLPTVPEALEIIVQDGEEFAVFPTWFRYVPNATAPILPFVTSGLPLMGLASSYRTYQSYISVEGADGREFDVPDVVQFSFQATDGLPAGRYYLKVNTEFIDVVRDENGDPVLDANDDPIPVVTPSATREGDLNFIFKIATLGDDILNDIIQTDFDEFDNPGIVVVDTGAWRAPAIIGSELLGGSTGTAFLQADNVYRSYIASGSPSDDFNFGAVTGFTIEVPGVDGVTPPEDLWLHVAIRSTRGDGQALVLNYFDFSQEPDHEWVELVNIDTDTTVDVSGWELAVEGGDRLVMTIPPGTFIAPGGMLVLGTNKFDFFQVFGDPLGRGAFFENGIGLARGTFGASDDDSFAGVTVPRTFSDASVFIRDDSLDFIDRNGDGLFDAQPTPDDAVVSTFDPVIEISDPTLASAPTKPWDRIVELVVPTLLPRRTGNPPLFERFDAASVGAIVLAGGIFPNRPEYDGIDNDRDNFILSTDLIDNDGDGFFDEFPSRDEVDNNSDGIVDEAGERDPVLGTDEGIDEGRFRRDQFDQFNVPVPGAFNQLPPDFSSAFFTLTSGNHPYARPNAIVESHRWKEFVERRNFPGDNVIVTLYQGPAFRNRVVDRITYNQRDVENSAIDDVVHTNDFDLDGFPDIDGATSQPFLGVPEPLDKNFTSFWPGNTMGIDFYRTLERKHPLYSGDRFGTQNRFTATDGNYDDWADSTGRWERVLNVANPLQPLGILDRFSAAAGIYNQFAHAFHGSPLRMNATQRYAQEVLSVDVSPFDPVFASAQFARKAMFEAADARNRNIVSAGDLLTLPHISKTNDLVTLRQFPNPEQFPTPANAFLFDVDSPNFSFAFDEVPPVDTFRENLSYNQALLGQNFDIDDPQGFFQDLRAVIGNAAANSSLALSVGQAEVFQLSAGETTWGTTVSDIPEAWVPVLLHDLFSPDAGRVFTNSFPVDSYQRRYLMQTPPSLPASVGIDRWPLESREAFYVSGNNQGVLAPNIFDPRETHENPFGAESLFVWDGNDGLENGEYVLYLVMGDDLRTLLDAHEDSVNLVPPFPLLTENNLVSESLDDEAFFGVDFVQLAIQTTFEERIVDVEVFTDRNGDRRVWTELGGIGPQTGELNDGGNGAAIETFGLQAGLVPDASGVIRYGVVRVENNYLAVMLRNWADAGNVNIFSRVILAPRDRTPGRININTVQTRRTNNFGDLRDYFNPLVGLPGVLERFADSANIDPSDRRLVLPPGFLNAVEPVFVYAGTDQAQDLARHIVEQRQRSTFESPDGRYYELTSDLLADAHGLLSDDLLVLRPPLVISDHQVEVAPDNFQTFSNDIDRTSNDRQWAFKESAFRFTRMQNLITTRSDVFEIIVTVQAGYGTDTNGDGRINYRDDREFTATAEKSARTVYER